VFSETLSQEASCGTVSMSRNKMFSSFKCKFIAVNFSCEVSKNNKTSKTRGFYIDCIREIT